MTNFDYKKYSLEQLENWMHDAMSSGEATPQEIYDTIRKVVEENYYTYKDQVSKAYELLSLLNGNGKALLDSCDKNDTADHCKKSWSDFWEDGYAYTPIPVEDRVNKWILPVEVDGASGEYFLTLPDEMLDQLGWKEGDTLEFIDNKNGFFSVKKVAQYLKPDEC
jgi:hypothetical protein